MIAVVSIPIWIVIVAAVAPLLIVPMSLISTPVVISTMLVTFKGINYRRRLWLLLTKFYENLVVLGKAIREFSLELFH